MTGGPPEQEPLPPAETPPSTAASRARKKAVSTRQAAKKAAAAPTQRLPAVDAAAEPTPDPLQPGAASAAVSNPAPAPDPALAPALDPAPQPEPEPAPPANGGYPVIDGIVWKPLHPDGVAAGKLSATWSFVAAISAVVVFVLGLFLVGFADEFSAGLVAILGAVSGGILLLGVGVGMLQLEALRAESVSMPIGAEGRIRSADGGAAAVLPAETLKELRQGLAGLTTARAAIFAGAFLLAIAALGGGISLTGDAADEPTPTPSPSVTPTESSNN